MCPTKQLKNLYKVLTFEKNLQAVLERCPLQESFYSVRFDTFLKKNAGQGADGGHLTANKNFELFVMN